MWSFNGSITTLDEMHWSYVGALGVVMARRWLDWGFTTVRSAGGADIGLKKAIDEGFVPGPRVFPSMATLTSTGGHGDWRHFADPHPHFGGARPRSRPWVTRSWPMASPISRGPRANRCARAPRS
ncbi:MAG: hypothetical protein JKP98_02770 [Rhodobacteraceae bacterium]|nr:hypothetical protein [Paracoccaceae bacterium]